MSDEEKLGHIGALEVRWTALVALLIEKGLITREEMSRVLDDTVQETLERMEEVEDEIAGLDPDDDEFAEEEA